MNVKFYMARPIINGFEFTLLLCGSDERSLKAYIDNNLRVPTAVLEISESDFEVFANSGFKVYMFPTITEDIQNDSITD